MDARMDELVNYFFLVFTHKIPMFLAPYFLYIYVQIQKYFERVKNQIYITSRAVQNSFQDEYLGFIKISSENYFPFLMCSTTKYSCEPTWIYDPTTNIFTFSQLGLHSTNHNLPFIGASVAFGNQTIGDLSDWMMDQKVHGPDAGPPLQVLVGAWRYYNDKTLMFSFKNYTITVITDDGVELVYNLENEEEINTETRSTPSATDETNDREDTRHIVSSESDEDDESSKKSN